MIEAAIRSEYIPKSIVIEAAASAAEPSPDLADWIWTAPEGADKTLAKSLTALRLSWFGMHCRTLNWHYSEDETVVVISGEASLPSRKAKRNGLPRRHRIFRPAVPAHGASKIHKKVPSSKEPSTLVGDWRASLTQAPQDAGLSHHS